MRSLVIGLVGIFLLTYGHFSYGAELTKLSFKNNEATGTCGPALVKLAGVDQNASTGRVGGYNYEGEVTVVLSAGSKTVTPKLGVGRISAGCLDGKTVLVIEDKAPATRNFKAYDAATLKALSDKEGCDGTCLEKAGVAVPKSEVAFNPPID
jgi:hypothetical protein